jgi:Arc/MetJ-type ribon-helix-helix transcriptional regulator
VSLPKRSIRISRELDTQLDVAAKQRGFRSVSALLRAAVEKELKSQNGDEQDHKVAASVDRLFRELRRVVRAQQAQFAYLDSLTKVLLTCVPEPSGETVEAAVARARFRYDRLIKAAGRTLSGESGVTLQELLGGDDRVD